MTAAGVPLRFRIGARTLATVRRRLVRVAIDLDAVRAGRMPALPALGDADGYALISAPCGALACLPTERLLRFERQRYPRYFADLSAGVDAWWASLSGNARSALARKRKRLVAASGGVLDVRSYHGVDALPAFFASALALSARTYQERLMGAGLPGDAASIRRITALAAADGWRAWLLWLDGRATAYLACEADGDTLRYDHVGHDPDCAALSPGTVLLETALRELYAERRFAWFDFTEGAGQHKRLFATCSLDCADLLLLRPTLANRVLIAALAGFDIAVAAIKRAARDPRLVRIARRVRR